MLYLILSIMFSSWWGFSYKIAFRKNCSVLGVITVAYGMAFILVLLWELVTLSFSFNLLSAIIGTIAGIGSFIATISYFAVIRSGARLGVTWTIMSLSMIVPISLSIFLWKEIPGLFQSLGLLSAITGIYLLGSRTKTGNARLTGKQWGLISAAFFLNGGASVAYKLIPVLGLEKFKLTYLSFIWGGAFILALGRSWMRKGLPNLKEIKVGVGMGIAGVGSTFFLLLALENLTGTLAFPLGACGNILFVVFITYLVWQEKVDRKEFIGLSLALLAIVFINL